MGVVELGRIPVSLGIKGSNAGPGTGRDWRVWALT